MKKLLLFIFALYVATLDASVSQGKEICMKRCLPCHLNAKALAGTNSAKVWQELFRTDELSKLHLKRKEAEASWSYFKRESYQNETRDLKEFLQKYSSDRGRHNSCN